VLYNTQTQTKSLYIHWPFCPYRCHFCPFVALAKHEQFMNRYQQALVKEIAMYSDACDIKQVLDTLYIGGGTPSTCPDDLLLDTFDRLNNKFIFSDSAEVTIEVNPGTVRKEQFEVWKSCGINRMSVGVQSLKDSVLHNLNRHQTKKDVDFLLTYAPQVIENISVDFIIGLPGVTNDEWKRAIQEVVTWPIKHISMYFLMVHEDTPLYFRVKTNKISLPKDDTIVDLYHWTRAIFDKHGFKQYEVSNFAKPGYESKHNTVYWERKPYKAFGLGACSFDGNMRLQNEKNLLKYLEGVEQDADVTSFNETLTEKQVRLEKVMLGLRRITGVKRNDVIHGLSKHDIEQITQHMSWLKDNNYIYEDNGYLKLTPTGLVVENDIVARLSS